MAKRLEREKGRLKLNSCRLSESDLEEIHAIFESRDACGCV